MREGAPQPPVPEQQPPQEAAAAKEGEAKQGARPEEGQRDAQLERWQKDLGASQQKLADLERIRELAEKMEEAPDVKHRMSAGDAKRIAELGGTEGIERQVRDTTMEKLDLEYKLTEKELARKEKEAGMTVEEARGRLAELEAAVAAAQATFEAARSLSPDADGPPDLNDELVKAIGARIEAGEEPEDIMAEAKKVEEDSQAKMEKLRELVGDADRLAEIDSLFKKLDQEKRAAIAAAEQKGLEQARATLARIGQQEPRPYPSDKGVSKGGGGDEKKPSDSMWGNAKKAATDFVRGFLKELWHG